MRSLKIYAAIMTALFLLLLLIFALVLHRSGYGRKLLNDLHLRHDPVYTYNLDAWANSLEQLDVEADAVFFGDSITQFGDWRPYFPDKTLGNLGHMGDRIEHLEQRVNTVKSLRPKKLFLMIGTNSLVDQSPEECAKEYAHLLDLLQKELPDTEIYLESLLPISKERDTDETMRTTEAILALNQEIQTMAKERNLTYIDLYSVYEKDGFINPAFTADGLHLLPNAYELWAQTIRPYMEE